VLPKHVLLVLTGSLGMTLQFPLLNVSYYNIWSIISGWWFQTCFIFHNIWDNHQPHIQAIYDVGRFCGHKFGQFWPKTPMAHVRLGVLCITLELILNPLHSFVELWPHGRLGALAVIEVEIGTKAVGNNGT